MTPPFYPNTHSGISSLHPYIPGKSTEEVAREYGVSEVIKLASNENPLGCSPMVRTALSEMSGTQIAAYPHPNIHPLRHAIASKLAVEDDMVALCNGSDLLFWLMLTTFALHQKKHLLIHEYSFASYAIQAQALGVPYRSVPLRSDWQVDIDALINACNEETALIFIANPNNPTGSFFTQQQLLHLMNHVPQSTLVLIDEAYYEFAYPNGDPASLALLSQFPNLLVSRTFSKAYGLASLRLGYAVAHPKLIELLLRVQPPFSVNQAALVAGSAALADTSFLDSGLALNQQGLEQMRQGLQNLQLDLLPFQACNFITFNCGSDCKPIFEDLLRQGIIVRPLSAYGLPKHIRVSIGKPEHNSRFLAQLEKSLINHGVIKK